MSDLDDKLQEFLDDAHEAKRRGHTIEAVYETTQKLANAQASHEAKCDLRWEKNAEHHASASARLTTLEAKADAFARAEEITGNHNLQAIQLAAEAKGLATAKRHDSLPPLAKWVTRLGLKLGERWLYHAVLLVIGGGLVWAAHLLRLLR